MMPWSPLSHRMHSLWNANQSLAGTSLLLLCSGGADSVALASLLADLSGPLGYQVSLGHFHHGGDSVFRQKALKWTQNFASQNGFPFFFAQSETELLREEEMRDFRLRKAQEWQVQNGFDRIVLAHHQDDLLETRFLRLLRGTGLQGLEAMKEWQAPYWRPLLATPKEQLREHLKWNQQDFVEDPSNSESDYTRNWVRNDLFALIDQREPGALRKMAESFDNFLSVLAEEDWELEMHPMGGLRRSWIETLSPQQKKRALAQYLGQLNVRHFTQNHLSELLKHLDISRREHRLTLAGCEWLFNAEQILAFPRASEP